MSFFVFFFLVVVQPCFHSRNIHRRRGNNGVGRCICDKESESVLVKTDVQTKSMGTLHLLNKPDHPSLFVLVQLLKSHAQGF